MNSNDSRSEIASSSQAASLDFFGLENDHMIDLFELGSTASEFEFRAMTLHNWMEAVYLAFNYALPTSPRETALLAIREATFAKPKNASVSSTMDPGSVGDTGRPEDMLDYDFSVEARDATMTPTSVKFNDVLILAYVPENVQESQHTDVFACTVDPGQKESKPSGMPLQCEGHLYRTEPSTHKGKTIGTGKAANIVALRIYSSKSGVILLTRDAMSKAGQVSGTNAILTELQSAFLPANGDAPKKENRWMFCKEENNITVHIHWSKVVSTRVKDWSTGCTAIHEDMEGSRYKNDFLNRVKSAPNSMRTPYLIVSSEYVKLYDDLYVEFERCIQDVSLNTLARMVIKKEALRPHPDPAKAGLYLPSFVSSAFADAVHKKATELSEAADAGEVSESLSQFLTKNGVPKNKQKPELLLELSQNLIEGLDNCCFRLNPTLFPPVSPRWNGACE